MKITSVLIKNQSNIDKTQSILNESILNVDCVEATLKEFSFCNLCEINASNLESQEDFNSRAKSAAFIGTLQASYTDFHYLRDCWKKATEKDALLGVSLAGIGSGVILNYDIEQAALVVKEENERIAKIIGIRPAARLTNEKPGGTVSLVLGTASGNHGYHDEFYLRNIRVGKNESIYEYLRIYHEDLISDEHFSPHDTAIISVPQFAPKGSILRSESALSMLERVKMLHEKWIKPGHRSGANTHNVSATVSIKDGEWKEVGEWMWENRDSYTGLAVLPYSDHTYIQAPFESINEERYNELVKSLHDIDLTRVVEMDDNTDLQGEAACAGDACSII